MFTGPIHTEDSYAPKIFCRNYDPLKCCSYHIADIALGPIPDCHSCFKLNLANLELGLDAR